MSALSFIFPFPPANAGIADYDAKLAALTADPRLDDVLAAYCKFYTVYSRSLEPFIKIAFSDAFFMLETVLWYLHGLKEIEGQGDGATMSKLQLAAFADRFLSPRSVNTMVDRMVDMGHLIRQADGRDGRVRRLLPTEECYEFSRQRVLLISDAMKLVYPESRLSEFIRTRPELYLNLDFEITRIGISMSKAYRQFEEFRFFTDSIGGFSLFIALFAACFEKWGGLKYEATVSVGYAALAQEMGVSRSNFRKLIRDAIGAGYLAKHETDDEQVVLPAKFIESGRGTMAYWVLVCHEAEQRVRKKGLIS